MRWELSLTIFNRRCTFWKYLSLPFSSRTIKSFSKYFLTKKGVLELCDVQIALSTNSWHKSNKKLKCKQKSRKCKQTAVICKQTTDFWILLELNFWTKNHDWTHSRSECNLRESRIEDKLLVGGEGHEGPTLPGSSSNLAIWCIFLCLALIRPLVNLCLAAMHLIWSSKVKVAERRGMFREAGTCAGEDPKDDEELRGLWTVTCRQRESSLSVTTSRSCGRKKNNSCNDFV